MRLNEFKLERYFAKHEFTAKYLLSSSDCDGYKMQDLLAVADAAELKRWETIKLGYTEGMGSPFLREAIQKFYPKATLNQILVASPGELNYACMHVLLQAGDHVVTISPSYQSLTEVVESIGCQVDYWKPNSENGQFNPTDLDQLVHENTKLIIINFPHNPTGSYLSPAELTDVVDIARKNDCYLYSDEMYYKLVPEGTEELQPVSELYQKGISVWGTSKSLGMAGLRTGWLVSQEEELVRKIMSFKDYLSMCTSAPAEVLTAIALNHLQHFLKPNKEKIKKNILLFQGFVNDHAGLFHFVPPMAGSTALVKLNMNKTSLQFCDDLVAQTGIMAVPGNFFGADEKSIRVGFGRANFPQILDILNDFLTKGK
ncbi:MAG: aminotransferase class I/II-fold pyridoxal phosphate-dependent enzyme [Bacteroidales bacterium]|nr:aminotransferase class I/II-fold pyridoxal phosphate-dependent enzyme [Bacteroidales bacterium]